MGRNKKVLPTEAKSKCTFLTCSIESEDFLPCKKCKSLFHPECGNFDIEMFHLLSENTVSGLSWSWHCITCVTNTECMNQGAENDPAINDLINKKFDEVTKHFDKCFQAVKISELKDPPSAKIENKISICV